MDMRECFSCNDVLLVPRYSSIKSRNDCDTSVGIYSIPLIASCMDTVYSMELDNLLTRKKIMVMVHRYFLNYKEQLYNSPGFSNDYRFYAVGSIMTDKGKQWIDGLIDAGIRHFVVDMAHGDSEACYSTVRYILSRCDAKVIAGNVAVKSGFRRLQDAGAWAIRVGVGSGSICTTRLNTGFGVPLLTSVEDCSMVKKTAFLIADGGVKYPGDIAKVIAFGGDFVMSGRMWASTDLAAGDCYDANKKFLCSYDKIDEISPFYKEPNRNFVAYKQYRGMASKEARNGILKNASIEGVSGLIKYTGRTKDFIEDLTNNLKASLSYAGAYNWSEFRMNAKKIRISDASWVESGTFIE